MVSNREIICTSTQSATLIGFKDNKVEENVKIGNGIAATENKNGTVVLLQVNEAEILAQGNSLLSTAQVQENGIVIDDTEKRHLGKQHIHHENTVVPMDIINALCTLQIQKSTEWELKKIKPIVLTSEQPWNPEEVNKDTPGEVVFDTGN